MQELPLRSIGYIKLLTTVICLYMCTYSDKLCSPARLTICLSLFVEFQTMANKENDPIPRKEGNGQTKAPRDRSTRGDKAWTRRVIIVEDQDERDDQSRIVKWSDDKYTATPMMESHRGHMDRVQQEEHQRGQRREQHQQDDQQQVDWQEPLPELTTKRVCVPRFAPPNLPGGYNSRQYPKYPDEVPDEWGHCEEAPFLTIAKQNRWRQQREWEHMEERRDGWYEERGHLLSLERDREPQFAKPYCYICSEIVTEVYPEGKTTWHTHHSSKDLRICAELTDQGEYYCETCEITPHSYKGGRRVALLISSSAMANWQNARYGRDFIIREDGYKGDCLHMDHVTIPGATIEELKHAYAAEYEGYWRPVDAVLVAGHNNLLRGESKEQVTAAIKSFKEMVIRMGTAQGHVNTFAVVTLYYPPILSRLAFDWMHGNKRFWNRTMDILHINTFIQDLNSNDENAHYTRHAPLLHLYGIRKIETKYQALEIKNYDEVLGGYNQHRSSCWREWSFDHKLHLCNKLRLRAGVSILHYYRRIYEIAGYRDMNREELRIEAEQKEMELERERCARRMAERRDEERRWKERREQKRAEQRAEADRKERDESMKKKEAENKEKGKRKPRKEIEDEARGRKYARKIRKETMKETRKEHKPHDKMKEDAGKKKKVHEMEVETRKLEEENERRRKDLEMRRKRMNEREAELLRNIRDCRLEERKHK